VATGVEVETQPPPLVAYELDEPEFLVDGVAWTVGPRMYSQPTGPTQRGRHDRASRLRRVLLGLFEPYAFSIVDDNGREVGRLYGNPIGAGGAGAFAASAGPTLTGPTAYLSNADVRRLQEAHDGSLVRLVSGGTLHPGTIQRNVLGLLRGEDVRTVVVSAHYDSAWGSTGVLDNATGVEGVLQLATELAAGGTPPITFLFALFAAEEAGLSGARAFVNRARIRGDLGSIAGIVNLDCIGGGHALTVPVGPPSLAGTVERAIGRLGLDERYDVRILPPAPGADHFPFVSDGVPGLTISYVPFPEYHLRSDDESLRDQRRFDDGLDLARLVIDDLTGAPL
jgi:Iap family predicted aminopeptidase